MRVEAPTTSRLGYQMGGPPSSWTPAPSATSAETGGPGQPPGPAIGPVTSADQDLFRSAVLGTALRLASMIAVCRWLFDMQKTKGQALEN